MYFKGAGVIFKTLISLEITQLFSRFAKKWKKFKKTKKIVLTKAIEYGIINKNKKTHPERLEMRKYNPVLKRHSLYREVK